MFPTKDIESFELISIEESEKMNFKYGNQGLEFHRSPKNWEERYIKITI